MLILLTQLLLLGQAQVVSHTPLRCGYGPSITGSVIANVPAVGQMLLATGPSSSECPGYCRGCPDTVAPLERRAVQSEPQDNMGVRRPVFQLGPYIGGSFANDGGTLSPNVFFQWNGSMPSGLPGLNQSKETWYVPSR
jgi:hypothetical protein